MFAKRVLMLLALLSLNLHAATYYVDASRINDSGPGTSWATAKKTIQSAVNLAAVNDTVLVTNGVYNTGVTVTTNGTLLNRVVITKQITVKSVNGAAYTFIEGSGTNFFNTASAVRCVYMANRSKLEGFTLRYGTTLALAAGRYSQDTDGGGLYALTSYPEIRDCVIRECIAAAGGGSSGGTLYSCLLTRNNATNGGGGCTLGTLYSCLIYDNEAAFSAGSYYGTRVNCTIVGNRSATPSGCGFMYGNTYNCIVWNNMYNGVVNNYFISTPGSAVSSTCTTPLPPGVGNITSAPLFVNESLNDYRLRAGSPCLNVGTNTIVLGATDVAGNPRIQNGTVDMGAYEGSVIIVTVTFDPQGGQVTPGSNVVTVGALYGYLPSPARTGYTFNGWQTSTNGTVFGITSNSVVSITTNHTLRANWTAKTYTLSVLNARGAAVPANGDHPCLYGDAVVASVLSVITDGNTRYICAGATVDGNGFTQAGTTNVTLTLTNNAVLTWQWSTNYFLSLTATNGLIVNTSEGWKPANSNYELSVLANPGYTFDHWEMNGIPIGSGVPLALTMDQPNTIIALFRTLFMDVSSNVYWNATWVFNPRKGYFIGTVTITNTNAFKVLKAPFWFQVENTTNYWLRYPTGINGNTGLPYLDITPSVTNQLPGIGNGDLVLDVGESVTVTGIELMGRRTPEGLLMAVWADPPNMISKPVDTDGDGMSDADEYIAGTSAVDPDSNFRIRLGADGHSVEWDGKPNRVYTVLSSTNLSQGFVIEQDNIKSTGKPMTHQTVQRISDPGTGETRFYRVNVNLK